LSRDFVPELRDGIFAAEARSGFSAAGIGLAEARFHVTDFMGDGEYPAHRAEQDEAERYVASIAAALGRGKAKALAGESTTCAVRCSRACGPRMPAAIPQKGHLNDG